MGKYESRKRRTVSSKTFILLLALVLVIGVAAGSTVAWLTATTQSVVNTFTYGDINIELTETKPENKQAKIIPGVDIDKDPKVTVKSGSEACWLFVKVVKAGDFVEDKVTYEIAEGWRALGGHDGVYYREVAAVGADTDFYVLKDNKVTVSSELTKTEIAGITNPTLTFTAYAVQHDGFDTAAAAWAKVGTNA